MGCSLVHPDAAPDPAGLRREGRIPAAHEEQVVHPCGGSSPVRRQRAAIRGSLGCATGRKVPLLSATITSQKKHIKSSPRGGSRARSSCVWSRGAPGGFHPAQDWFCGRGWSCGTTVRAGLVQSRTGTGRFGGASREGWARWAPGNQQRDEQNPPSFLSATREERRQSDLIKKLPLLHSVPADSHKPSTTAI